MRRRTTELRPLDSEPPLTAAIVNFEDVRVLLVDARRTDRIERFAVEQNSELEEPQGFGRRVPLSDLIDLEGLERAAGRRPSPKAIREALPPGWVLCDDGLHAARDRRLLFKDGWVLLVGLICFGAAGIGLFWNTFPRGWRGLTRFAIVVGVVIIAGGLVAPIITRSLNRR